MTSVLSISQKTIGKNMSGLGIRVWELAKILGKINDVTIICPGESGLKSEGVKILTNSFLNKFRQILKSDIVIVQIYFLGFLWLFLASLLRKKIVIDAYYPFYLENLERYSNSPGKGGLRNKIDELRVSLLMRMGDHFICASSRQKDLWLGWLSALGRVNSSQYRSDKSFHRLIDIVPFGIRPGEAVKTRNVLRGVIKGIGPEDKLVLWFSGVWPWLDPISAIKAISMINDEKVKLVFFGINALDPFFEGGGNPVLDQAIAYAEKLGLKDKRAFFVDDRVPYEETSNLLLEADVALNIHHDHLETKYAYRGRILEYIRANIPVVATKGDVLAEEIARHDLGIIVGYEDAVQISSAIIKLLTDKEHYQRCKDNMKEYAKTLHWEKACVPLEVYCAKPFLSPDNKSILGYFGLLFSTVKLYCLSLYYLLRRVS